MKKPNMYIDFEILRNIGWIVMIAAGCAALIYLALVFKNLVVTAKELTKTLEILQADLAKLESPLETVEAVSKTMDELQQSVKKTATSALTVMDDGLSSLKNRFSQPKDRKDAVKAESSSTESDLLLKKDEDKAEFVPIQKESPKPAAAGSSPAAPAGSKGSSESAAKNEGADNQPEEAILVVELDEDETVNPERN